MDRVPAVDRATPAGRAPTGRAPSGRQHRDLNAESRPWIEHLPPVEFHQVEPHQVEPLPFASIEI